MERERYQLQQRRGLRRHVFVYPVELQKLPEFSIWIFDEVKSEMRSGGNVDAMVLDTARGPLEVAHMEIIFVLSVPKGL